MTNKNIKIKDMKTYIVEDYKVAYSKARRELGANLIIIEKKEIKVGGFFGLFAKKKLKITFGLENTPPPQKKKGLDTDKEILDFLKKMGYNKNEKVLKDKEKNDSSKLNNSGLYKPYATRNQNINKNAENNNKDNNKDNDMADKLKKEITEELRKEFSKLQKTEEKKGSDFKSLNIQREEGDFWKKLRKDDITEDIIKEIKAYFKNRGITKNDYLKGLEEYFKNNIKLGKNLESEKFLMLVGPTGVGKTTSCAKLVANKWNEEGDVALITADTYRLEAVSQLKAYANIMKIAVEVIKKPEELNFAIEKFKDKDLLVMDTAGRSPKNKEQMDELKEYTKTKGGNLNVVLVLSATSKLSVLCEIIEKFESIGFSSIIFTKIDETDNIGSLLTISKKYDVAVSYITTGQKVPDDIEKATKERLAQIFIKGLSDGSSS
ncbi:MAG: flagellar biosynthesis protein FlhF [Fusobacteriota bacterium]